MPKGPLPDPELYERLSSGASWARGIASGTMIWPAPVAGLTVTFSPMLRIAPPPLGRFRPGTTEVRRLDSLASRLVGRPGEDASPSTCARSLSYPFIAALPESPVASYHAKAAGQFADPPPQFRELDPPAIGQRSEGHASHGNRGDSQVKSDRHARTQARESSKTVNLRASGWNQIRECRY